MSDSHESTFVLFSEDFVQNNGNRAKALCRNDFLEGGRKHSKHEQAEVGEKDKLVEDDKRRHFGNDLGDEVVPRQKQMRG